MASSRALVVEIIGDDRSLQRAYKRSAESTAKLGRETSRVTRGAAAGSGVFRTLGRSLAFASGGFIAAAGAADLIRGSIEQASKAAATQKQLAAQFRASGQNLSQYQDQIDRTTNSLSQLAGIENDEVKAAFTAAFRVTQDVSKGLKITAIAADVARARNISLIQATIALDRAYGGASSSLRRLGIIIPTTLHGMAALNFVQRKFAGQASAGTTSQERFTAAFKNFEEVIGTALLPTFQKLLDKGAKWLSNTENQRKAQKKVNDLVKIGGNVGQILGDAWAIAATGVDKYNKAVGRIKTLPAPLAEALKVLLVPGYGLSRAAQFLGGGGGGSATAPRGPAGPVGTMGALFGLAGPLGAPATTPARIRQRASLAYQISLAQQNLARAELTSGLRDDRAVLVRLAALTRAKITKTHELAARTQLLNSLGQIEQQIASIDEKATADKKAQNEKELAAQKRRREAIQAQSDKVNREFAKMLAAQKAAAAKLKERLKQATDAVRSQIGALFSGPVLNTTESATKGILGVTGGGGPTIGTLTRDVIAQTAGFVRRNQDLARLARAGAPGELLKQLREGGDSALIHTLATSGKAAQQRLFKAVSAQEKVIQQIAHADIQARTVVVHAGNVRHSSVTPSSQRRGRGAGIVQGGFTRGD